MLNYMKKTYNAILVGYNAFREDLLYSKGLDNVAFESFEGRRLRYDVLWSFYQQSAYKDVNSWITAMKQKNGSYKYIRALYNPAHQIGNFYKTYLLGGHINRALPFEYSNERIEPAVSELFKWSNWSTRKDILAQNGAVLGDQFIEVVNDVEKGRVYLRLLHPKDVAEVNKDAYGNIKGYVLVKSVLDENGRSVVYREDVSGDGNTVRYQTFKNDKPYGWFGQPDAWELPYGFVPVVHIQHNNVGGDWGWSELQPSLDKFLEVDDMASLLGDQLRKEVNPMFLFTGVSSADAATFNQSAPSQERPKPGRESMNALYAANDKADVKVVVGKANIPDGLAHLDKLIKELEREYPALKFDALRVTGELSGRALTQARQPVEALVRQRRNNYDEGIIQACQMGLAIGGDSGYEAYKGFGMTSFAQGDLEMVINDRPVFAVDEYSRSEEQQMFWLAAKAAQDAGVSLESYLLISGWPQSKINELSIIQQDPSMGEMPQGE